MLYLHFGNDGELLGFLDNEGDPDEKILGDEVGEIDGEWLGLFDGTHSPGVLMIKSNASERRDFFTKSFKFCEVSSSRINSEVAGDISTFNSAKPHMKSEAAMISSKQSTSKLRKR